MTKMRLVVSRVADTELYTLNLPETCVIRSSGAPLFGLSKDVAHRVAASFNALAEHPLEEIEAGVVQTNQDSLEYACEKIRLQQVLVEGCSLHPSYRAKQPPRPRIYCPACERMWEASQELKEMSAGTVPRRVRPMTVESVDHFSGVMKVALEAALVEEKPAKGVQSS